MREKWVIVPRVRTAGKKLFDLVMTVLTVVVLMLAILAPFPFAFPALAVTAIWFFMCFRGDMEFEYSYFDGELRLARIKAKSKRKSLGTVMMDDVLAIAPKGDRSVYKYENDKNVAYKNLSSGRADAKVYELVFKGENGINRYEFEPDEEMLDAMLVKYARVIVK